MDKDLDFENMQLFNFHRLFSFFSVLRDVVIISMLVIYLWVF